MVPRVGFVVEQALGHVAYGQSLLHVLRQRTDLDLVWLPIPYEPAGFMRVPVLNSNWTLRGSLRALAAARREEKTRGLDALFLHTQTIALFSGGIAGRVPTLLSLDATPKNLDALGPAYGHPVGNSVVEHLKLSAVRYAIRKAARYTTWSEWAKDSLVRDYGAPAELVTVIHPGTNLANFPFCDVSPSLRPLRVLFVGGDFHRKGGDVLLKALERDGDGLFELHLVTSADVESSDRVHVYKGLRPHSNELLSLYASADVFALPTRGDCLAVVLGEALAAGLPIISTPVGAHAEVVDDGENGFIVPVDDVDAVLDRITRLARSPAMVREMAQKARMTAETRFDVDKGANAIGDILKTLAEFGPSRAHGSPAASVGES